VTAAHSPETWISQSVAKCWPAANAAETVALKGDASTRRFWRVSLAIGRAHFTPAARHGLRRPPQAAPKTAIAIDLGPDDLPLYARTLRLVAEPLPEPPWVSLQRFLRKIDVAVPELYHADLGARMLLVEDVGELPLFTAAEGGDAGDLYRLAADELVRLHLEGTRRLDAGCIAARIAYDERLFRWELEQFVELGAAEVAPGIDRAAIAAELDELAARLGRLPRVLSHRDYHGHNLFVQIGRGDEPHLRVIDFQDALMAPAAQDLAVLLTTRDTSRIIPPRIEQRILEYYYAALIRHEAAATLAHAEFVESYRLCVLQHALKVIGRFVYLERNGKTGYAIYIPYALAQARRMLTHITDFPRLREAIRE
jgi:aminoglycoside/choline kinase family phosphotransferase